MARGTQGDDVADELRSRIEAGTFSAGQVLPSEASLSKTFEASRVTVRKALDVLRDEGLISSRQGAGWFVAVDPLQQSLGRLGTIEAQLAASKRASERQVFGFGFVAGVTRSMPASLNGTPASIATAR